MHAGSVVRIGQEWRLIGATMLAHTPTVKMDPKPSTWPCAITLHEGLSKSGS
eukprot:CAMPEP_0177398554 /NCGR_PEP_ID=MMETSP0368-20130122/57965_1 /TAXON_ID=447022 ORGANISM="Scrippsiella hangoei-like, Strain SHHI-4" /NCGR_SAMPLE_ID=MMETSP0368 /ASSEMBLY_ACC=CAM_ASM_000363 /LENGTH=51 /DNA_ID=CAMNT_0018865649 /DNA_START=107 /DNA_END=262 /DNA_ORIENTATION=+